MTSNSCPNCKARFKKHQCIDDPVALPEDGDIGVCYRCGGWWTLKAGRFIEYTPTQEEMAMAIPKMLEIRP